MTSAIRTSSGRKERRKNNSESVPRFEKEERVRRREQSKRFARSLVAVAAAFAIVGCPARGDDYYQRRHHHYYHDMRVVPRASDTKHLSSKDSVLFLTHSLSQLCKKHHSFLTSFPFDSYSGSRRAFHFSVRNLPISRELLKFGIE